MFLIRWRRSSFDFSEYGRIPWFPLFPPLPGIWRTSRSDGSHRSWGICRGHRRGQGTWRISVWRLDHDFCSTSEMLLIPGAITLSLPSRHRNLSPMSFLFSFPCKRWDISDPSSLPGVRGYFFFWWFRIHLFVDGCVGVLKDMFWWFLGIPPASPWDLLNSCWFPGIYMSTKFPGFLGPIFFGSVDLLLKIAEDPNEAEEISASTFLAAVKGRLLEWGQVGVVSVEGRCGKIRGEKVLDPPTNSLGIQSTQGTRTL